jgi:tetratricopeptide (TPR) repeat protein
MATVSPPKGSSSAGSKGSSSTIRPARRKPSNAPVFLVALLVLGFFVAVSAVIATDDVAGVLNTFSYFGWVVAGLAVLVGLGIAIRRGKAFLGLGLGSFVLLLLAGAALAGAAPVFSNTAHASQGTQALLQQNYDRAITEFRLTNEATYLHKELPEAYLLYGNQLTAAGDYQKALDQYAQVISPEFKPNGFEVQIPDARAKTFLAWADKLDTDNARLYSTFTADQRASLDNDMLSKYDSAINAHPSEALANQAKSGVRNILYRQAEDLKNQSKFEDLDALYQKISLKYLDGTPQSLSELESRMAQNYLEWSRQATTDLDYDQALTLLEKAESRYASYDPRKVDTVTPEIIDNFSKLAPQLITAGKYDEAVTRLEDALKTYGSRDSGNVIAKALLNSYIEYGNDLEARNSNDEAISRFKQAFDINQKYAFNDARPRTSLGKIYLSQAQTAEQLADYPKAIALFRDGLNTQYFSQDQINTAKTEISSSYYKWGRQTEQANNPDRALEIYKEGLQNNIFDTATRPLALDAGGSILLKRGTDAEAKDDLQGAIKVYNDLAADPLFKDSASGKSLATIAPKAMFTLSNKLIGEGRQGDTVITDLNKLTEARTLLISITTNYPKSDYNSQARDLLNAQITMTGKITNNQGQPLGSRPVQFSTDFKLCTASTPDNDPDCQGRKEGIAAKGEVKGFDTAPDGGFVIKLNPGRTYYFSWQERGGKWITVLVNNQPGPTVTVKTDGLVPVNFNYSTPTAAPAQ